jgi:hypothetical protein
MCKIRPTSNRAKAEAHLKPKAGPERSGPYDWVRH